MKTILPLTSFLLCCVAGISTLSLRPDEGFAGDRDGMIRQEFMLVEPESRSEVRQMPEIDLAFKAEKQMALKEIETCEDGGGCDISVEKLVQNLIKYEDGVLREDLEMENQMLDMAPEEEEHLLDAIIPDAEDFREMVKEEGDMIQEVQLREQCRRMYPEISREREESSRPSEGVFRPRIPKVCLRFCGLDSRGNKFRCRNFLFDKRFKFLYQRKKLTGNCYQCQRLCDSSAIFQ